MTAPFSKIADIPARFLRCLNSRKDPMARVNLLFFFLIWAGGIGYAITCTLTVKIPASSCFFLLGCLNTAYVWKRARVKKSFLLAMLAGLLLGLAADIVLEFHFLGGAAVFALGHICYAVAYSFLLPPKKQDLLFFIGLFLACLGLILFLPVLDFGSGFMQGVVIAYALIICLMLAKAAANYRRSPDPVTKLLLIGSILFFFSDFMLLFAYFSDAGRITNILCLNTYYPGQALLAASIYLCADSD